MHASLIFSTLKNILVEMGRYEEAVYRILSEPVTPNEIAKKLRITQKTAQRGLMHLALTRGDVKYKIILLRKLKWNSRKSKSKGKASTR